MKKGALSNWIGRDKNQHYTEIFIRSLALLVFLCYFFIMMIPVIQDLIHLRNRNFSQVSGVAKNQDHSKSNTVKKRTVTIIEEKTNEQVRVSFFDDFIDKDEKITVIYLPNTGFGSRVIEKKFNIKP